MDPELLDRIRRLHAALGRVVQRDLTKFPARIHVDDRCVALVQDFSGGATEAELSDTLHSLIHNIASFHDHLQKWGGRHGVSEESVHNFLRESSDFCVVRDLWNNDKHGYPPRNDGWSRKAPRLLGARCMCRLATRAEKNSAVRMTLGRSGRPITSGDGSSSVIITGEVVDKNGSGLGEAYDFIERSLRVCEAALRRFGVTRA